MALTLVAVHGTTSKQGTLMAWPGPFMHVGWKAPPGMLRQLELSTAGSAASGTLGLALHCISEAV
jgi:hypothetical protein